MNTFFILGFYEILIANVLVNNSIFVTQYSDNSIRSDNGDILGYVTEKIDMGKTIIELAINQNNGILLKELGLSEYTINIFFIPLN